MYSPDGGAKKQPTVNEQVAFDIDEYVAGNSDMNSLWVDLPSWVQSKIDESFEVKAKDTARNQQRESGDFESLKSLNEKDDKPFPSDDELKEDDLPF